MNILVFGAGAFGTAFANELAINKANNVVLYTRNEFKALEINSENTNIKIFPNSMLDSGLKAMSDTSEFSCFDVYVFALPSKIIPHFLDKHGMSLNPQGLFINLSKGVYEGMETVVERISKALNTKNVVTLKGPSFANELINHSATLMTLGYSTKVQLLQVSAILEDTSIRIDSTMDVRGVELLSVLKNIYAILMGVVDARYNSANTRFMVMTKAYSELCVLLSILGGRRETALLSCGYGDLGLTALNDLSRNRTLGLLIGKGFFCHDSLNNSVILEGVNSIRFVADYIEETKHRDLPLFRYLQNLFDFKTANILFDLDELIDSSPKTVLTYGTFDLLHFGHIELLRRASELGDRLIVGLSTDEFNRLKGKESVLNFDKRKSLLESIPYVDMVIPENSWKQKQQDIEQHGVDLFVMGDDWRGKFDELSCFCEIVYLARTLGISTTKLKSIL